MLPIESVSAEVVEGLEKGNVLLVAPPGAGKSTFLPIELLKMPALKDKQIVMLQPRRVAVRAIASFLASQLGEEVGQTVGYRIRGESKISGDTRLTIVTEGLLTRMIQSDPELARIGLVLFDEFHERNIHGDLALAFCIEVQDGLRSDLRLLVMSATLDVEPIMALLPDALLVQSEGRSYPVETVYHGMPSNQRIPDAIAGIVLEAQNQHSGNILVFLPGVWEINQVAESLKRQLTGKTEVLPLHGSLSKEAQQQAIQPTSEGIRKIVLATNIAETSLTIDGITVVVDSGLEKVALFNLNRGMTRIQSQFISQASSIQRQGRAGRLAPGVCHRAWAKEKQSRLAKQSLPEILCVDIASAVLEAAVWGSELTNMPLLNVPTAPQLKQATELLTELQALSKDGKITSHGRAMASLGCHPRLANMLLKAKQLNTEMTMLGCLLCALFEGKGNGSNTSIHTQLTLLQKQPSDPKWHVARQWARRLGQRSNLAFGEPEPSQVALLTAFAYPDHIAKNTGKNRFLLAGGSGANLAEHDSLLQSQWLAIGQLLLGHKADAKILLAEPITMNAIELYFSHMIQSHEVCEWRADRGKIVSEKRRMFGQIQLDSVPLNQPSEEKCLVIWSQLIRQKGLTSLNWNPGILNWIAKLKQARKLFGNEWPDVGNKWLEDNLEHWCGHYLSPLTTWRQVCDLDWSNILKNRLEWSQQQKLETLFPSHLTAPTGNRHRLEYAPDGTVSLSIRIQEVYGLRDTPCIADGRQTVQLELLSPAHRPIQTTADLAGFWAGSYEQVKKEMKGRYPRHFWPDDPANAQPTTRTKKRM